MGKPASRFAAETTSSAPRTTTEKPAVSDRKPKRKPASKQTDSFFIARHKISISVVLISIVAFLCLQNSNFFPFQNESLEEKSAPNVTHPTVIGGWRLASPETLEKYDPGICNVERVSIVDLPPSRFESEFRFQKPVLVTFPNGARDWTRPQYWTKEALISEYQNWTMKSGQSLDIVRKGGNAKHKSSFLEFVDKLLSYKEGDEPLHYGFDRDFYFKSNLPKTLHPPPYFKVNTSEDESIFFLGASLTGVVFHKHSDTWNGVVYGRKRWFLYPVNRNPPGGVHHGFTLMEWVNNIYPHLQEKDKPVECVQEAGEILYLPENTYHATLNLGDTIAVAIQKKTSKTKVGSLSDMATEMNSLEVKEEDAEKKKELNEKLLEVYKQIFELLPGNTEAIMKIGFYLSELKMHEESMKYSARAIEMDPLFVMAYYHLGRSLTALRQYDRAEAVFQRALEIAPMLWDGYKEYGEFLMKRGRYADAVPIMQKGTELRPKSIPFWFYYKECLLETGNTEEAKRIEKIMVDLEIEQELNKDL